MNRSGLQIQLVAGDPAFLSCNCNWGYSRWSAWPVPGGACTTNALNCWLNKWEPYIVRVAHIRFRSRLPQFPSWAVSSIIQLSDDYSVDFWWHLSMLCSISSTFDSGQPVIRSFLQLHCLLPSTSSGRLPFLLEHSQTLHWRRDIDRMVIRPIICTSIFTIFHHHPFELPILHNHCISSM